MNGDTQPTTRPRGEKRKVEAALALRLSGATYTEIARTLGYTNAGMVKARVEGYLARSLTGQDRAKARELAAHRLERLLRAVWTKAVDPNHPEQLVAVARAKDIIDRHAKLYGLDAPTEVVVHSPTTTEIEAWVARLSVAALPPVAEYDVIDIEGVEVVDESGA